VKNVTKRRKSNKKQKLSSFDVLSVIVLCLIAGTVFFVALNNSLQSSKKKSAIERIHKISKELAKKENFSKQSHNTLRNRGPASTSEKTMHLEGQLEKDPWLNPYSYKVLRNAYGQVTHLVVWSAGPNGSFETTEREFLPDQDGDYSVRFAGDDFGEILLLR
jgi:hypothetical protein